MKISYNHDQNIHTLQGPKIALPLILEGLNPTSLLDVGCGIGTWLKAVVDIGISDVFGVDGVDVPTSSLLIPRDKFKCQDLSIPWDLKRRFDVAICLEVAEHVDAALSEVFIQNITLHSDTVLFAAACPGQSGQQHINCQWPDYWQGIFNKFGFVCDDSVRWKIWNLQSVEVWYRQNIFTAVRSPERAGLEERIRPAVHPELVSYIQIEHNANMLDQIENGEARLFWYLTMPAKALLKKVKRKIIKIFMK